MLMLCDAAVGTLSWKRFKGPYANEPGTRNCIFTRKLKTPGSKNNPEILLDVQDAINHILNDIISYSQAQEIKAL